VFLSASQGDVYGQFFDRYSVAGFGLALHRLRRGIGGCVFLVCPLFQTQQRRCSTWCEDSQVHTLSPSSMATPQLPVRLRNRQSDAISTHPWLRAQSSAAAKSFSAYSLVSVVLSNI
jgi:hypothetical protein